MAILCNLYATGFQQIWSYIHRPNRNLKNSKFDFPPKIQEQSIHFAAPGSVCINAPIYIEETVVNGFFRAESTYKLAKFTVKHKK